MASQSQTFNYTGAQQTLVVPTGVNSLTVDVQAAQGLSGGQGGRVQAVISVTPGETLYIYVGQSPSSATGGFNGGGNGGSSGKGGGGASDIRQGGNAPADRKVVAGGGGGGVKNTGVSGGSGGGGHSAGLSGYNDGYCDYYGCYVVVNGGGGGTQSAGGAGGTGTAGTDGAAGSLGQGGAGAAANAGGGGGGYYGGGGGESDATYGGGGGGGSNFTAASGVSSVTHTNSYKAGNGAVILYWYVSTPNLDIRAGRFTKATATGTQAITGLGFTPKAVIFWSSGGTSLSTYSNNAYQIFGVTAGSSNSLAVGGYSQYAASPSNTSTRTAAKAITMPDATGSGILFEADLTSFDTDGFTLNWTTNAAPAAYINYLAIGGTDVSAKAVSWTTPTATGNKTVAGVGFTPDLVLHASDFTATALPASTVGFSHGLGAMNAGGQWANAVLLNDAATSGAVRVQRNDACLAQINTSQTAQYQASYVSMDADGFTTNFSATQASARQVISLAIRGVSSTVSFFDKSTSTSVPVTQAVTGSTFTPKAVLMASTQLTTTTNTNATEAPLGIGASSGSVFDSGAAAETTLFSSTTAYSYVLTYNKTFIKATGFVVVNAQSDLTSLNANGFTLSWTQNDAVATRIFYIALGDAALGVAGRTHQMIL